MNQDAAFRQSRALRDLHWAIESPSLITSSEEESEPLLLPDLGRIDVSELETFLSPYSRFRIGEYFEGLILYWLERMRGLELIAQHEQVFAGGQTVGEVDFLFRDEAGVVTHRETAVKFYLYCPTENPAGSHFIGPNVKDTFEKKMRRLFEHQLPLSEKHFPQVTRREAFVKGMIFYHPDDDVPGGLPGTLSPGHARGTWIRFSELSRLRDGSRQPVFLIREKPDWLSPSVCPVSDPGLLGEGELQRHLETHFRTSHRPILVSVMTEQQAHCQEVERAFIVPDQWPHIH